MTNSRYTAVRVATEQRIVTAVLFPQVSARSENEVRTRIGDLVRAQVINQVWWPLDHYVTRL